MTYSKARPVEGELPQDRGDLRLDGDVATWTEGIGQKLRQRRKVRRKSLKEVATRSSLSIGLLSQIERGISSPSLRSLKQICEALEMPMSWLFDKEAYLYRSEEHTSELQSLMRISYAVFRLKKQ